MKKKDTNFPLYGDYNTDFEDDDHFILNYRPKIEFIEPAAESFEGNNTVLILEPAADAITGGNTIEALRDRTQQLINGLEAAAKRHEHKGVPYI